tara:strand:+ start:155 stop:796 length:642 start_codon:yes stop_codon:yes gene_type:complete
MEKIEVMPQTFLKFECPKKIITDTFSLLEDEVWDSYEEPTATNKTYNYFLNRDPKYSDLFEWIGECLVEVKDEMGFLCDELKITQSWGNRSRGEQWHRAHTHPNSFLSGILYITGSDSQTWFSMDSIWSSGEYSNLRVWGPTCEDHRILHKQSTVSGDMIIFPSSIKHSVNEHMDNWSNRYSISFNVFPSGKIGIFPDLSGMEIRVIDTTEEE